MIYKSVYQSQTEDGESMTADTLHEDDPTTNTGVCKRVKEDSMVEEPGIGFIKWPTDAEVRAHFDDYVTAVGRIAHAWTLGRHLCTDGKCPDIDVVAAVWYSTYSDRAQREMLRAAILASPAYRWRSLPSSNY